MLTHNELKFEPKQIFIVYEVEVYEDIKTHL